MAHKKKAGGDRKHGRAKTKCGVYRMLRKRERSRIKRIEKHIEKYKDNSDMAKEALERYRSLMVTKKENELFPTSRS